MTDQELKDLIANLAVSQAKMDKQIEKLFKSQAEVNEQFKKTDEKLKKTDKLIEKLAKQISGIGNNQGAVAEEFFYNSLQNRMKLLDMEFDDILLNLHKSKRGLQDEFDIVLINGKNIVLIEVKYKAHKNDIDKLDKKIKNFRKLFPEYSNLKLYAGIATFHIYKEAKEFAKEKGYFILKRVGDIIEEYKADKLKVA